jgi:hypothetical protein
MLGTISKRQVVAFDIDAGTPVHGLNGTAEAGTATSVQSGESRAT